MRYIISEVGLSDLCTYIHSVHIIVNERATLAGATLVVIHSIFVLGPSALGMGENYP